jgi:hypothetical protein
VSPSASGNEARSNGDPRAGLREIRRALFKLHKSLIDAERSDLERVSGPLSSGAFLQALLQDPDLVWLRSFSGLIVDIDEALAAPEPMTRADARRWMVRVRELVSAAESEGATTEGSRYGEASRRDPDVLLAHVELMTRLNDESDPA